MCRLETITGLAAHSPAPEVSTTVEERKTLLASEQFIDSWDDIVARTKTILDAYCNAYCILFFRRKQSCESADSSRMLGPR